MNSSSEISCYANTMPINHSFMIASTKSKINQSNMQIVVIEWYLNSKYNYYYGYYYNICWLYIILVKE